MNKKKLIICSPQLGISPESNLGGEVHDREIINSLCELGVKVIIILPKNKKYLFHKNLIVYYLPFSYIWPPYLFNLLIVPYLFIIFRKEKFDILRIHSPYFAGLGAWFFRIFHPDVFLIAIYHHLEDKKLLFAILDRLFINKWDVIFVESRFTRKEIIEKYGVNKRKIFLGPLGIKSTFKKNKKSDSLFKKHNLKAGKTLLFMGGLKRRKNISFLLKVMSKINDPSFKLIICGQGSLYYALVKQARELKITKRVIFSGFIREKEKTDYYNLADIFVMPSLKEGFGLSVLEAAACGVPSVASNISSLKEIVLDSRTGYLAKVNDINDWKTKIEKLLEDDQLRKRMGQSAQEFSQNFSWGKTAKQQIKIYESLIINPDVCSRDPRLKRWDHQS